ncbi:MAG: GNAT family N-acetyltransferase [Alphaproteobacteria bacterium]
MTGFAPLVTDRLVLRLPRPADAPAIQRFAGDERVARMTAAIPYPYPDGAAEAWIAKCIRQAKSGDGWQLAVAGRHDDILIGAVRLEPEVAGAPPELGYWIAVPHWGRGFATEAARRLLAFGFDAGGYGDVRSHALADNAASRRVLEKVGLEFDGLATVEHRGRNAVAAFYATTRDRWSRHG